VIQVVREEKTPSEFPQSLFIFCIKDAKPPHNVSNHPSLISFVYFLNAYKQFSNLKRSHPIFVCAARPIKSHLFAFCLVPERL